MEFTSTESEQRYAALVAVAARSVVGLDFDGTLSPIVEDPTRAHVHPEAGAVLRELSVEVAAVAVVTGRPVRQALDLGRLEEVGAAVAEGGKQLFVLGQYGNERWTSGTRRIVSPRPPAGLSTFLRDLPRALRQADAADAWVEDKGLAHAVHTRRLPDPHGAHQRLLPVLRDLAARNGLAVEPGRHVIEVRAPGMDKGQAVELLARELDAGGFLFAGDDLGDVPAFKALRSMAEGGMPTLLVCSASEEEGSLVELADVVVEGPDGVLDLLRRLAADARAARGARSAEG